MADDDTSDRVAMSGPEANGTSTIATPPSPSPGETQASETDLAMPTVDTPSPSPGETQASETDLAMPTVDALSPSPGETQASETDLAMPSVDALSPSPGETQAGETQASETDLAMPSVDTLSPSPGETQASKDDAAILAMENSNPAEAQENKDTHDSGSFIIETPPPPPQKTKAPSSRVRPNDAQQELSTTQVPTTTEPVISQYDSSTLNHLFVMENIDIDTIKSVHPEVGYVSTLYTEDGEELYCEKGCVTNFVIDRHLSFLYVSISQPDGREGYEDSIIMQAGLRFPYAAFSSPGRLRFIGKGFKHPGEVKGEPSCYEMLLPLNLEKMAIENILVPNPHESIVKLKNYVELAKDTDLKLKVHICTFGDQSIVASNLIALQDDMLLNGPNSYLRQWIHPEKRRFVIQHNEFIPSSNRPEHFYMEARTTFFNLAEYLIFMCIGDLEEYEKDQGELAPYHGATIPMSLMSVPGGGRRVFLGLFKSLEETTRLREGQVIYVMHHETSDTETALRAVVTAPLPGIPLKFTTVWLSMRWDSEAREFDTGPFDIDYDQILPIPTGKQSVSEAEIGRFRALPTQLEIASSDKSYRHRVAGLATFHQQCMSPPAQSRFEQVHTLILGNNISDVACYDVYSDITDTVPNINDYMTGLNEGQKQVIQLARNAPAGFVIVQGPPGTGKSYVAQHLVWPLILAKKSQNQVLDTATSNGCVDTNAVAFDRRIRNMQNWDGQYAVRIHAVETEIDIARQAGLLQRGKPAHARPELISALEEDAAEMIQSMDMASVVYKAWQTQHKELISLIHDSRVTVQSFRLAVGFRILQLIGVHPKEEKGDPRDCTGKDADKMKSLKEMYGQFCAGSEFDSQQTLQFAALLREGRRIVLRGAAVVCTTPALASEAKVYSVCAPLVKAVISDEAAQVAEQVTSALLALYPSAALKAYVGDIKQLSILIRDKKAPTFFRFQYARSQMARFIQAGVPFVFLTEQYRMAPDISRVVSRFGYRKKLVDNPCVRFEERPMQASLRQWNKIRYGRERSLIYLNVRFPPPQKPSQAEKMEPIQKKLLKNLCGTYVVPGGSRVNEVFVVVGIELAKDLVDTNPGATVAILTGYNAQYRLYLHAKTKLAHKDNKYSSLVVSTIDGCQGMEFDIVIIDFLLTDTPGFLADHARVNVGMSRARFALYVLGNKEAFLQSDAPSLKKIQSEILQVGTEAKINPPWKSEYFTSEDFSLLTGFSSGRIHGSNLEGLSATSNNTISSSTPAGNDGHDGGGWSAGNESHEGGGWSAGNDSHDAGNGWQNSSGTGDESQGADQDWGWESGETPGNGSAHAW